ncbi:energy transducer TonB [Saccharicrinis sp. FJH54]|uniref:energy transducer TonB n=1 Tax=Saccharicrinis sp. FJH54 TaxID=3344665 RepID=UPI0035D4D230
MMRQKKATAILLLILFYSATNAQEKKEEYSAFMKNGIEYRTNGKDTIIIVDPKPEFKGGDAELMKYLSDNIKYPAEARKKKITGKVFVKFTVAKNGKIMDCKIEKSVDPILDKEALRLIKSMPRWKPGEQNGKPIPVSYTIPINFMLE